MQTFGEGIQGFCGAQGYVSNYHAAFQNPLQHAEEKIAGAGKTYIA